jgi:DNA-binding response OmpR family regulator
VETVSKAKGLGCKDFLVKPVNKNQLLNRVESLLKGPPPVLQDKNHVMDKLGVGAEEYDNLINALVVQLGTAMPVIVLEQAESEEAISENASRLLKEIAESAAILGADTFSMLYSRLKAKTSITRSNCVETLKVLQELNTALAQRVASPAPFP